MKINNFRGDLTDNSAKKEALVPMMYQQAAGTLHHWCVFSHVVTAHRRKSWLRSYLGLSRQPRKSLHFLILGGSIYGSACHMATSEAFFKIKLNFFLDTLIYKIFF